jgi:hypothetical protein
MSKHGHYTDLPGFRGKVGHTSENKIVCKRRSVLDFFSFIFGNFSTNATERNGMSFLGIDAEDLEQSSWVTE